MKAILSKGGLAKIAAVTLLLLVAGGCNKITWQLVFNNLDYFIVNQIDDIFDLTDAQEDYVDAKVDELLDWVQTKEIPKYLYVLGNIRQKMSGDMTAEDIRGFMTNFQKAWGRFGEKVTPDAVDFLQMVEVGQAGNVSEYFTEYNEKYEERLNTALSKAERQAKAFERMEEWYGEITPEQRTKIIEIRSAIPDTTWAWHEVRLQRQKQFLSKIRNNENVTAAQWKAWLQTVMRGSRYEATGKAKQDIETWFEKFPGVMAATWNTMNAEQRAHARGELDTWIYRLNAIRK